MPEIDIKPLNKNLALGLSKLKDVKVPEIPLPLFTTDQTEEKLRKEKRIESLRKDYKFCQKCLRVLSKRRNKEELIWHIKNHMFFIEKEYEGLMYELSKM